VFATWRYRAGAEYPLSEKNVPLKKVFKSIEGQTGYVFFFNYAWLRHARKVNVEAKNTSLMEALELCSGISRSPMK